MLIYSKISKDKAYIIIDYVLHIKGTINHLLLKKSILSCYSIVIIAMKIIEKSLSK